MKNRELKSLKITFKNLVNGNSLTVSVFENLIEKSKDYHLKNFFRGCKHILERHYTEAIKWFQLADNFEESILLILFCSLKVKDSFLFNEYGTDNLGKFKIFQSYSFYPFITDDRLEHKLDLEKIKHLKKKYLED